ncbi:v-type sodium ATPase subunit I [Striga asiatica]|uniref:V-type sodium ATPase subunit I n=1 Tax=Striga asiatica TaxID=4170 RepID=A0A5A7Q1B4_STRAF|nr:v-type sodium ATPase subunit I [Striga asiatica]
MSEEDEQMRVLQQLCAMTIHVLRSTPLPISFPGFSLLSSQPSSSFSSPPPPPPQISPAAFGLLFTGISVALMLFGLVTFIIGFVMMPLVIMLVMLFYVAGFVSVLSEIGGAILWRPPHSSSFAPVWNYASRGVH